MSTPSRSRMPMPAPGGLGSACLGTFLALYVGFSFARGWPFDHVGDYLRAVATLLFTASAVRSWVVYRRSRRRSADR